MRVTLKQMRHQDPSEEARDILLDVFLEGEADDIETVFLSDAFSLASRERPLQTINFIPKL